MAEGEDQWMRILPLHIQEYARKVEIERKQHANGPLELTMVHWCNGESTKGREFFRVDPALPYAGAYTCQKCNMCVSFMLQKEGVSART